MVDVGDDVLEAWAASGTETVMLPNRTEVRVMLPGPGALARHGVTPGVLRGIVGRLTGAVEHAGMAEADWETWDAKLRILVSDAVVALRPPRHDEFSEYRLTPERIAQRKVPPADYDALVAMVLRLEAPAQVDARSRALHGEPMSPALVARFAKAEQRTVPAWMTLVESSEGLMCAMTARMFGKLPSELLHIDDEVTAYAVDTALMLRLALARNEKTEPMPADAYERPDVPPFDPAEADRAYQEHLALLRREGRLTKPVPVQ